MPTFAIFFADRRLFVAKVDKLMAVLDAREATRTTPEKLHAATIAKLHAA